MLNGIDISNWNTEDQLKLEINCGCDFVIMKASEGCTFVDTKASRFLEICVQKNVPVFFYHFCRFERNYGEDEADHFLSCVNTLIAPYPDIQVGMVADYEGDAVKSPEDLRDFLVRISETTECNPLVYMSESIVKETAQEIDVNRYGLWLAKWGRPNPVYAPWPVMAMWQYTNYPIDRNYFYGNLDQLKKYMTYPRRITDCQCECRCCQAGGAHES